jgi:hypothetical protein
MDRCTNSSCSGSGRGSVCVGGLVRVLGIIERIATVYFVGLGLFIAGAMAWRYFGPPILQVDPNWWNINFPIPRTTYVASNFGTYELVSIEKNVGGTWTPITPAPLRANIWGFAEYITPPNPDTSGLQLGKIDHRAVGLETGKIAYMEITVSNVFR